MQNSTYQDTTFHTMPFSTSHILHFNHFPHHSISEIATFHIIPHFAYTSQHITFHIAPIIHTRPLHHISAHHSTSRPHSTSHHVMHITFKYKLHYPTAYIPNHTTIYGVVWNVAWSTWNVEYNDVKWVWCIMWLIWCDLKCGIAKWNSVLQQVLM